MNSSFVDGECAATLVHLMSDCPNKSARAAIIASSTSNETFPNVSHDAILSYLSSINLYSAPGGGKGIDYDNILGALGILGISYSIPQSSQEVLDAFNYGKRIGVILNACHAALLVGLNDDYITIQDQYSMGAGTTTGNPTQTTYTYNQVTRFIIRNN